MKKGYWFPNGPLLINNPVFESLNKTPYVIVDGGAAGDVEEPFSAIKNSATFVRFEPRGRETVTVGDDVYVDGGLWNKDSSEILHVAKRPTTSSVYPPNKEFLQQFDYRYGLPPRTTDFKLSTKMRSVDSAVKNLEMPKPNFIKLDIHSAEFEAIEGALGSLEDNLGFLVETWHSDVHKGQHLHGELEKLLVSLGYEVVDTRAAAKWHHEFHNEISLLDKPRYIGSEMLFLRKDIPKPLLIKYLGLCDLFNFTNLVRLELEKSEDPEIRKLKLAYDSVLKKKRTIWRWSRLGIIQELKMLIKKLIGRYEP